VTHIIFNNKTYNSVDEMPAAERQAYEQVMSVFADADKDGIPDIFEGDLVNNIVNAATTTVFVNGQPVSSMETLPPEARAKLEQGMATLRELGFLPQDASTPKADISPSWEQPAVRASTPIAPTTSAISEDRGPRLGILFAALGGLAVCGVLAVAAFFLLQR
jgi:hypothetical protein